MLLEMFRRLAVDFRVFVALAVVDIFFVFDEIFLGMGADLGSVSTSYEGLDFSPVLSIEL